MRNVFVLLKALKVSLPIILFFYLLAYPSDVIAERHLVRVIDYQYSPKDITITQGDTVVWDWVDNFHDTRAGVPPNQAPVSYQDAFESPVKNVPFQYEVTFSRDFLLNYPAQNNLYHYYCSPHYLAGMVGSIQVIRTTQAFTVKATSLETIPSAISSAVANCTGELSPDETEFTIQCSHSLNQLTGVHIHRGLVGSTGAIACDIGTQNPTIASCPLTQEDANELWDGGMYVDFHSQAYPDGEIRGQLVKSGTLHTIKGKVTVNGSGLQGVRVTAASRSALTDSSGNYTIKNVPGGVYTLVASKTGYIIQALSGTNPAVINGGNIINRSFSATVVSTCDTDTDGDQICDRQEILDGSSPEDLGSYKNSLTSPIYSLWNGFLRMGNVLELINKKTTEASVKVSLYNAQGIRTFRRTYSLPPLTQRDLLLNDLPGFQTNSYGIVAIEFDNTLKDAIDGRIFFYRESLRRNSFEFVFGVPFTGALKGKSAVTFNTFQPSTNPRDANNIVSQWLALVNLDTGSEKSFTLNRYSDSGELLITKQIKVPSLGRIDIEGGHELPGENYIGLNTLTPLDPSSSYLATLYRYGGGDHHTGYQFAYPLLAKTPNGQKQFAPLSLAGGSNNWVEIANTLQTPVDITLEYFNHQGTRVKKETQSLPRFGQKHFSAAAYLGNGAFGSVKVTPSKPNSIIGQSVFYFREQTGSISSVYGSPIREAFGTKLTGSYNLFLGMNNWLKLINNKNSALEILLTVHNSIGSPKVELIELSPHQSIDLDLHDTERFKNILNSYGLIQLQSSSPSSITAELLRIKSIPNNTIDFSTSTPLQ